MCNYLGSVIVGGSEYIEKAYLALTNVCPVFNKLYVEPDDLVYTHFYHNQ